MILTPFEKDEIDQLIEAVVISPKYKFISRDLIYRIGSQEVRKRKNLKTATKETKNKLHQVGGSFFPNKMDYHSLFQTLEISNNKNENEMKDTCLQILKNHQSTLERLEILDHFYQRIFAQLPKINSILDLACGLNPLTSPWIPGFPGIQYQAIDVYSDLMDFINRVFLWLGIQGNSVCQDILSINDLEPVDIAFLLKTAPCLELLESGSTNRLLEKIKAKYVLLTFPTKSIGGKNKGMVNNYSSFIYELISTHGWDYQVLSFSSELAFLINKHDKI